MSGSAILDRSYHPVDVPHRLCPGAALVFLDLLEGQADRVAELSLAHAEQRAAQPYPAADMDVDCIGTSLPGRTARYLATTRHFLLPPRLLPDDPLHRANPDPQLAGDLADAFAGRLGGPYSG